MGRLGMTKIVAELGINHGGNLETALEMCEKAAEAGVDAVKTQSYRVEDFIAPSHPDYQMFKTCELSLEALDAIHQRCAALGLEYGSTPTNVEMVAWLASCRVDFLKNGSDFLLRHDLLHAMAKTGLPTVISTGMATQKDVFAAQMAHMGRYTIMVCTSEYPCPPENTHLARIGPQTGWFGFSDHTQGITAAIVAAARGATMIEKHFTLDKTADGPDHWFSADPGEMSALVQAVREVETLLGSPVQAPTPGELLIRDKIRVTEGQLRT